MNVARAAIAAVVSLLAAVPTAAHATGVLPCPEGETGSVVVVGDDSVSVCTDTRAECAPHEVGTSVYLNGARLARFCHEHPAPGGGEDPPPPVEDFVDPVVCAQLRPLAGAYGFVEIRSDGDVYVGGEPVYNCPPY